MCLLPEPYDGGAVDPRESNLPVWAKRKLDTLRGHIKNAESEINELRLSVSGMKPNSNTFLEVIHDNPFPLGKNVDVGFVFGPNDLHDTIRCRIRDGELEISGGRQLIIVPRVSNVVAVHLR
jgi:hypothetical protein